MAKLRRGQLPTGITAMVHEVPAAKIDATNTFPRDLWEKIGALGLHCITVKEEDGGAGLGYLAHVGVAGPVR